ncbi:MAG: hypothetical protein E2O84_02580 [Bacteroidetes bacterium]|nr:MAG: hypothetical protein E2O84_02580 [Bacteroidota bacterium]
MTNHRYFGRTRQHPSMFAKCVFSIVALTTISTFLLLLQPEVAYAQEYGAQVVETGFVFTLGSPQGELAHYLTGSIIGFHAFLGGRRDRTSPVVLGTELGLELYGSEQYMEFGDGPEYQTPVTVNTYNNIGSGHLFVRLQPATGFARPYIEALAGLKVFFVTTVVSYQNQEYDEPISTTIFLDGAAFSYGAGGGISINLLDAVAGDNPGNVFFTIGARYLMGAEATYLTPGSVSGPERNQSETHLLETRFGIELRFW